VIYSNSLYPISSRFQVLRGRRRRRYRRLVGGSHIGYDLSRLEPDQELEVFLGVLGHQLGQPGRPAMLLEDFDELVLERRELVFGAFFTPRIARSPPAFLVAPLFFAIFHGCV